MTIARKHQLLKTLSQLKYDLDIHNYTHALGAASLLTCAGFGVPAFSTPYWHAKYLQHKLYYYGTWSRSLGRVYDEVRWIADRVRRTKARA